MARRRSTAALRGGEATPGFIAYYRVSTDRQGKSGLGLEAQRAAVERHVTSRAGRLLAVFEEVESGKRRDRPQLELALAAAKARRAVLVIAKLDRLARDAHFLLGLERAGVEFIAADMPNANRLTVGIMAMVAEEEARMISARTKAALQAAKARGVKLGNPRLLPGTPAAAAHANAVRTANALAHARGVLPYLEAARSAGASTLTDLAEALRNRGVATPTGRTHWDGTQVRNCLALLKRHQLAAGPDSSPSSPGLKNSQVQRSLPGDRTAPGCSAPPGTGGGTF